MRNYGWSLWERSSWGESVAPTVKVQKKEVLSSSKSNERTQKQKELKKLEESVAKVGVEKVAKAGVSKRKIGFSNGRSNAICGWKQGPTAQGKSFKDEASLRSPFKWLEWESLVDSDFLHFRSIAWSLAIIITFPLPWRWGKFLG